MPLVTGRGVQDPLDTHLSAHAGPGAATSRRSVAHELFYRLRRLARIFVFPDPGCEPARRIGWSCRSHLRRRPGTSAATWCWSWASAATSACRGHKPAPVRCSGRHRWNVATGLEHRFSTSGLEAGASRCGDPHFTSSLQEGGGAQLGSRRPDAGRRRAGGGTDLQTSDTRATSEATDSNAAVQAVAGTLLAVGRFPGSRRWRSPAPWSPPRWPGTRSGRSRTRQPASCSGSSSTRTWRCWAAWREAGAPTRPEANNR
jgi:hypothetical protein